MLRCPNCQSSQIDGTIFCTQCGGSLMYASEGSSSTAPFERSTPVNASNFSVVEPIDASPSETRLTLHVLATGHVLRLRVHDELLIGRKDEARGILPDVDLGAEGGYDAGVSRRHAIISWQGGSYYLEDLGSANGTFVNDQQLTPQGRAPIRNGDAIRCGMLDLRVEISP